LSIIGICLWLPSFSSDIHIDRRGIVNPTDPFKTPFELTNDGLFPIYNVGYSCLGSIMYSQGSELPLGPDYAFVTRRLGRGETADIMCLHLEGPKVPQVVLAGAQITAMFTTLYYKHGTACGAFVTHFVGLGLEKGLDWRQHPCS
jgi:hypothetical protein